MQTGKSIERFLITVATFSRELNTARVSLDIFFAIRKVLTRFFEVDSILGIEVTGDKCETVYKDENFPLSEEDIQTYLELSFERKSHSFFPADEGLILIVPLVKSGKVVSTFFASLKQNQDDFKQEYESILNFISFFSGIVLENLKLYQTVLGSSKMQEELKKYFQKMLNSLDEGIGVLDQQLNFVFVNDKYTNLQLEDSVIQEIKGIAREVFEKKQGFAVEKELEGHFYSFNSVIIDFPFQVLVRLEDITNTKELERLKKIDAMKTEFVSNISHELRTPLSAIKAYAETIKDSIESMDPDMLSEFMGIILDQSSHLQFLLDQLLDFSRVEENNLSIEMSDYNLVQLIEDTMKDFSNSLQDKKVLSSFKSFSDPVLVHADYSRIKQVLFNLISNAIKYRKKESDNNKIDVLLEESSLPDEVIVSVNDNGTGISEEFREKIFEKFFRIDSKLTYEEEGTGLGLSIAKEIIQKHGTKIWVESGSDEGANFRFSLKKAE